MKKEKDMILTFMSEPNKYSEVLKLILMKFLRTWDSEVLEISLNRFLEAAAVADLAAREMILSVLVLALVEEEKKDEISFRMWNFH